MGGGEWKAGSDDARTPRMGHRLPLLVSNNNNDNNDKCFIDNREVSTILCVIQIITGLD